MRASAPPARSWGDEARPAVAERPLVSVVIPCYNQGQFLREAIESVLAQTWRPLEVVVVDDGSVDCTPEVMALFPGITAIRQANGGLSAARNTGLNASRGAFVTFLDADDLLLPNALAAGMEALEKHPDWAFVWGGYRMVDSRGLALGEPSVPGVASRHYDLLLSRNYIAMHATVLYRRDALDRFGGFDISLLSCEDYDLYLRIARESTIGFHPNVVACYRRHDSNMSRNPDLMLSCALEVLNRQKPYLANDNSRRAAFESGVRFHREREGSEMLRRSLSKGGWEGVKGIMSAIRMSRLSFVRLSTRQFARSAYAALLPALPPGARTRVEAMREAVRLKPPLGFVRFGSLRRLHPISRHFGYDRGQPIDRVYIEGFLERQAGDVRGHVLEIGDRTYTQRFGGARVTASAVLNINPDVPGTTFVGDLADGKNLPSDAFDCIILTQTLHLIYDLKAALDTVHRILKPGGVVLATVPGISQIDHHDWGHTWFWSLTPRCAKRLFGDVFPQDQVEVESHGNVLTSIGALHGLAASELRPDEIAHQDPQYPMVVTVRARKAEAA
ncbi:glycosyltransferase [Aquabacter sp. CN5-332]|uniref:glycosyltransferase n=1 Tax=Aquabacter sp. CN5-332 TaxID=3156608 RepID=UPI0032B37960